MLVIKWRKETQKLLAESVIDSPVLHGAVSVVSADIEEWFSLNGKVVD